MLTGAKNQYGFSPIFLLAIIFGVTVILGGVFYVLVSSTAQDPDLYKAEAPASLNLEKEMIGGADSESVQERGPVQEEESATGGQPFTDEPSAKSQPDEHFSEEPFDSAQNKQQLDEEPPVEDGSTTSPQCETSEMIFYYKNGCGWCQKVKDEGIIKKLEGLGVKVRSIDVQVGLIEHEFRGVPTFVINEVVYSGYRTFEDLKVLLGCQ